MRELGLTGLRGVQLPPDRLPDPDNAGGGNMFLFSRLSTEAAFLLQLPSCGTINLYSLKENHEKFTSFFIPHPTSVLLNIVPRCRKNRADYHRDDP